MDWDKKLEKVLQANLSNERRDRAAAFFIRSSDDNTLSLCYALVLKQRFKHKYGRVSNVEKCCLVRTKHN